MKKIALASGLLFTPFVAFAHPADGASVFSSGLTHPLTGFDHLIMLLAFGLLVGWGAATKSQKLAWGATGLAMMVVGVGAGKLFGSVYGIEIAILASLFIVSGALWMVFSTWQKMLKIVTGVCAAMLFFHGYAHGVEAHGSISAFTLGMTLTASVLMLAGMQFTQFIQSRWISIGITISAFLALAA